MNRHQVIFMFPSRIVSFRFALGSYSTWSTRLFPGLPLRLLPLGAHSKTTHNGLLDFLTYISEHLWLLIKSVTDPSAPTILFRIYFLDFVCLRLASLSIDFYLKFVFKNRRLTFSIAKPHIHPRDVQKV